MLVAVSFIPPQSVGGVKLRRANILSDLLSFDDAEAAEPAAEPALFDEEEFHIDMAAVAERIEADTTPREVQITYEWLLAQDTARRERAVPDSARFVATLTPIEDFSDSGRIQAFCDTLLNAPRPVRIAFLGDSFVEGDILTADLRERLQSAYSGGGAGFAPMASPLTAFRRTVKTQSKGWTTYNIMQRKAAPARLRENFYVSGWVSQPAAGASTRWESTDYRKRLDSCTTARVFFLSPRDSRVEVTLNDAQRREFDIAGDDAVRQIAVSAPVSARSPSRCSPARRTSSATERFSKAGASWSTTTPCAATTGRRCSGPTRRSTPRSTPCWATIWWCSSTG